MGPWALLGSRWRSGQPKSPKLLPKSQKNTYFCSKFRQCAHSCCYYKIQNKILGSVPPCISMSFGTIFAGRVPILQVSRFVAFRSNDSSCDPIRGHFGRLDSSRARLCGPALTTRFKTKIWAAFRLVFLCFLERFLQAEYRVFRFLGLWPFGRMTPPATLFAFCLYVCVCFLLLGASRWIKSVLVFMSFDFPMYL